MSRPQFTVPAERPQDSASRQGTTESEKNADPSVPSGSSANVVTKSVSSGPEILEQVSWRVRENSRTGEISVNIKTKDSGGATLANYYLNASTQSSLELNPGVRVPDGGSIELDAKNHGNSDAGIEGAIVTRPE